MKRLIKQNLRFYSKFLLFIGAMLAFICSFGVSSYAWTEDSNGNLVSDNLLELTNQSYTALGVNISSNNGIVTINGTATTNGPIYFNISVPSGIYSLSVFNQYISSNDNFYISMRYSQSNQIASSIVNCDIINDSSTFTANNSINYLVVRVASGVTYNNVVLKPMLVGGSTPASSYELYGKVYYSNDIYEPVSQLYYGNLSKAYLSYTNVADNIYALGFVYNGRFGYCDSYNSNLSWSEFDYQYAITMDYISNISTSYGLFYNTNWSLYDFIQEVSDTPGIKPDKPLKVVYEFITLQDFNNTYFSMSGFPNVNFYDINGALLGSYMGNSFNVTLNGVNSIELIESSGDDVADDVYYLVTDFYNGYYLQGYQNGYSDGTSLNGTYYQNGYSMGYQTGFDDFMHGVYSDSNSYHYGYDDGYSMAAGSSYASGYAAGYAKARADTTWIDNSTANATDLFWTIGSTPWETFKNIWNVNFLGINIANVITGFITALIIIWLIKKVWK